MKIFSIDPGNVQSAYVIVEADQEEGRIAKIFESDKCGCEQVANRLKLFCAANANALVVCEQIASYGMPVGRDVLHTCEWFGEYRRIAKDMHLVHGSMERKQIVTAICMSGRAGDPNVIRALVDKYTPGEKNYGKGTKAKPGFFHGFADDIWQAFAVADAWVTIKREESK